MCLDKFKRNVIKNYKNARFSLPLITEFSYNWLDKKGLPINPLEVRNNFDNIVKRHGLEFSNWYLEYTTNFKINIDDYNKSKFFKDFGEDFVEINF